MQRLLSFPENVQQFLEKELNDTIYLFDVNSKCTHDGTSVLSYLCDQKNPDISKIKWIVSYNPDVNIQDDNGISPLMICCTQGQYDPVEIIKLLLAAGADPNLRSNTTGGGYTSLMYVIKFCKSLIIANSLITILLKYDATVNFDHPKGYYMLRDALKYFEYSSPEYIKILTMLLNHQQYTIINKIGFGAHSYIYDVLHVPSNERYALKLAQYDVTNDRTNELSSELVYMKYLDHPNINKDIYNDGTEYENAIYYVMDLAIGSLDHFIRFSIFQEKDRFNVMKQLASAINYIHSKKLIHSDIKVSNILVFENNVVKLSDFGNSFNMCHKRCKLVKR